MTKVIFDGTVTTDQGVTIITEHIFWLIVHFTCLVGRFLDKDLFGPFFFQLFKRGNMVTRKSLLQPLVCLDTLGTDELGALSTKGLGLVFQTHLTLGLYLPMSKLQLGVYLLHAIDKESCGEVVHTGLGESGVFATLWTGEGLVHACPQGEVVDALLAVVMTARGSV